MPSFNFEPINVPNPAEPYVYIAADGVDAAGDAVGNYSDNLGDQDAFGTASATVIDTGGIQYVSSGGTAIAPMISGDYQYVVSGGVASGTTINAGTLELTSGASAGPGGVTLARSGGGTLRLDDSVHFGGPIAGFGEPEHLDLSDSAFGSSASLSFTESAGNASGTLTVIDSVHTANLILLG
jgi:autotransporter passenger strand-loop-strand repeat protein